VGGYKMNYYRDLNDVVDMLKICKEEEINVNLLIGAGCSVTAGIPTAEGLIYEIKRRYPNEYKRASNKNYPTCMSMLTKKERKRLILEFVNNAKINWAHLSIAQLIKNGYINRVLTTNFDNLLSRACSLVGEFPGVYDLATSTSFRSDLLFDKSILYLHGQYTGFVQCNTGSEVCTQRNNLEKVFDDLKKDSLWIVVGYSGQNDAVLQLLTEEKSFENRLFWVGFNDQEPSDELVSSLLCEEKYAFYVKGYDSDKFFVTLTQKLECFPPKIIEKPFTYLSERLNELTEYKLKSDDSFVDDDYVHVVADDIVQEAVKNVENNKALMANHYMRLNLLDKAISLISESNSEERGEIIKKFDGFLKSRVDNAKKYIDTYEKVENKTNIEVQSTLATAYEIIADNLDDDKKVEFLHNACAKYEQLSSLGIVDTEMLNAWALLMVNIGDHYKDKDINLALKLYNQAYDKYHTIEEQEPENIENLLNINDLYRKEAMLFRADDKKVDEYMLKAIEILKKAYEKDRRNSDVLIRWANYLIQMTLICKNNCEELIAEANKKLKLAYEIDTKEISGLIIWAKTLLYIVDRNLPHAIKVKYIDIAIDKIKSAFSLSNVKESVVEEWRRFINKLAQLKIYSTIYEKYYIEFLSFMKEQEEEFKESYIDRIVEDLNSIAYNLINQEREYKLSKVILEGCAKLKTADTFYIATQGLWHLRNKSIDIKEAQDKGEAYYTESILKTKNLGNEEMAEALLQKFFIEKSRFAFDRLGNIKMAVELSEQALAMGKIIDYEFVYEECYELVSEINGADSDVASTIDV
jgi:NAD-dependent SIR2 family protein deacetylase